MNVVNADQTAAWDGPEGDRWAASAYHFGQVTRRFRDYLLDTEPVRTSDRVLDVGCGTGSLSRAVARRAENGSVLGVDLSTKMLGLATELAAAEALTNAQFIRADAQIYEFDPGSFDLVVSSFGVMFFDDQAAAFANLAAALRPGGRIAMLAWRDMQRNEWMQVIRESLAMGRNLPSPPKGAPGGFRFADAGGVRDVLAAGGFADIAFHSVDEPTLFGFDTDDAMQFLESMGPVQGLLGDLDDADRAEGLALLRRSVAEHETSRGVALGASVWLITAVRS